VIPVPARSTRRPVAWLLLLAACSSPPPAKDAEQPASPDTPAVSSWTVTPRAFGTVQVGWTVAELNAALGDTLRPTYEISDDCDHLMPAALPKGTSLMVIQDTVVRIDVYNAGILTPEGAGVGDTEARLREIYGARAVVTPHKYTGPEGHYVTVMDPAADSVHMTIFETDGAKVLQYRAGVAPGVQYVEGCA
jgi:hypothetical protein